MNNTHFLPRYPSKIQFNLYFLLEIHILLKILFIFRFQSERNPTKQVRLGDRLDFTCGHDTNLGNAYLVNNLHSFENCDSTSRRQVLFNCEKAGTKKTIKILEVNPHPFAPIFLAGQDYYLVGKYKRMKKMTNGS